MSHDSRITFHEPPSASRSGAAGKPFVSAQGKPAADIRTALRVAMARLEGARVPSAALAAELLLMRATGRDRAWLYAHPEYELEAAQFERYFSLVARRASGVPTQQLTGRQEFWGLEFEVTPDVLIPRPETEHVIEVALERLEAASHDGSPRGSEPVRIADIGTGSGCIAVSLAHELPLAQIVATDISTAALEVAKRNAARHGVASRIAFIESNLLDFALHESRITLRPPIADSGQANHPSSSNRGLRASESQLFDLIVSNPPYIARRDAAALPREVRDHEPEAALYGGEAGTEIYAPLIRHGVRLLKPGGILVVELGYDSAEHVSKLLGSAEWARVVITNDLAGIPRVASARRNPS